MTRAISTTLVAVAIAAFGGLVHAGGQNGGGMLRLQPADRSGRDGGGCQTGEPVEAAKQLRVLASDAKLDLNAALDLFESRNGLIAARGIDTTSIRFSTAFGRGLDYYTGFEFELHAKGNGSEPLVGGGRYDGLLTRLGAREPIPAVGFSIWIEALAQGSVA